MHIEKNSYSIWNVDGITKLRFRLLCVTKEVSAASLFEEMVNRFWEEEGTEEIAKEQKGRITKIIQRTLRRKRLSVYEELLRLEDEGKL